MGSLRRRSSMRRPACPGESRLAGPSAPAHARRGLAAQRNRLASTTGREAPSRGVAAPRAGLAGPPSPDASWHEPAAPDRGGASAWRTGSLGRGWLTYVAPAGAACIRLRAWYVSYDRQLVGRFARLTATGELGR